MKILHFLVTWIWTRPPSMWWCMHACPNSVALDSISENAQNAPPPLMETLKFVSEQLNYANVLRNSIIHFEKQQHKWWPCRHINFKLNCRSLSRKSSPGYDLHQAMMGSWNIILLEWKCLESFKLKFCIMYQARWIKMGDLNTKSHLLLWQMKKKTEDERQI